MSGTYMEVCAEVARVMGQTALRSFGGRLPADRKSDDSPVTMADRAAEQAGREWIARHYAGDEILGEEQGHSTGRASRRQWILDPVDGTRSFIRGVPLWASLVAFVEDGRVVAGAADFPALNEVLCAGEGEGCWWNRSRASVSATDNLSDAALLTTDERFFRDERSERWRKLSARAEVSRTWGDAYGYLLVATGRADVMVDTGLAPWDAAPFRPIIEEAGGSFTDWAGNPAALGGDVIAANAALSPLIIEALR